MTRVQHITEQIVSTYAADVAAHEIDPDEDLMAIGVLDSLSLVRLISWISAEYNVDVNDLDLHPGDFRTVHKICTFIQQHHPESAV